MFETTTEERSYMGKWGAVYITNSREKTIHILKKIQSPKNLETGHTLTT